MDGTDAGAAKRLPASGGALQSEGFVVGSSLARVREVKATPFCRGRKTSSAGPLVEAGVAPGPMPGKKAAQQDPADSPSP